MKYESYSFVVFPFSFFFLEGEGSMERKLKILGNFTNEDSDQKVRDFIRWTC